tara:strand:+ start:986 stop:1822 length:837 start_codon:yes stop_codon:yes gene_type:complete
MKYRIKPSNLSGIIAVQLGDIEADVRGRIQDEVRRLTVQFANECPSPAALTRIIGVRNNLSKRINGFQGRIRPFRRLVTNLEKTLTVTINLIRILKLIPIPTATGTPPTGATADIGGFFFAIPIKITNKYADLLRLTSELAASIEDDIKACNVLLQETETDLVNLRDDIDILNPSIEECTKNQGLSAEQLKQIREAAEGENKTGTAGANTEIPFRSTNGKDYTLSVQSDPNSPSIAPKRFAVAKDQIGVVVLRGPSSFASSTEVLIQELKFRIDNQLP